MSGFAINGFWLAIASAEHVRRGRMEGIMQVCHGKAAPLRRIRPGDGIVYYSPTLRMGDRTPYRRLTAIGIIAAGDPYPFDMGNGFHPWRRHVTWMDAHDASITPLLPHLSFSAGRRNWGQSLRYGLIRIQQHDFACMKHAMHSAQEQLFSLDV
ncbi:EVE domain-containing protein [Acetobacter farinalis]|uniref:UPF0310 protein OQ252_04740 n=1 Tax=Acetobacter farinalis TaxID=1260984 RepID=A0ABT3Q5Z7_9PROT|nr:EVE domain-containing protein [Acetobacter farinalis]MCX2560711.1 EVE domain-containing protein [Acetobacter farinalis]